MAELFLEALPAECHVILICTDTESDLAQQLGLNVTLTLAEVLEQAKISPLMLDTPATLDWLMTELVVDAGLFVDKPEQEIICMGKMPGVLEPEQQAVIDFSLPRLLQHANLIIADGSIDILKPSLLNFDIRPILVVRPEDDVYCEKYIQTHPHLPGSVQCILSKAVGEDIPPTIVQEYIVNHHWNLLGKIPRLPCPGEDTGPVKTAFQDCLRRLDLLWQV